MPESPPKEISMEVRLLLAFLLMGAVMFLTPYFYKSSPAAKKTTAPAASLPHLCPWGCGRSFPTRDAANGHGRHCPVRTAGRPAAVEASTIGDPQGDER